MYTQLPALSLQAQQLSRGMYQHYRTKDFYAVLGVARHSEDHAQELVVYQRVETGEMWARPIALFLGMIDEESYKGPRFTLISKEEDWPSVSNASYV